MNIVIEIEYLGNEKFDIGKTGNMKMERSKTNFDMKD